MLLNWIRAPPLDANKDAFASSFLLPLHSSTGTALFQQWYTSTMNLVGTWLTDRMDLQLHVYQLKILIRIVKVTTPFDIFSQLNQGSLLLKYIGRK